MSSTGAAAVCDFHRTRNSSFPDAPTLCRRTHDTVNFLSRACRISSLVICALSCLLNSSPHSTRAIRSASSALLPPGQIPRRRHSSWQAPSFLWFHFFVNEAFLCASSRVAFSIASRSARLSAARRRAFSRRNFLAASLAACSASIRPCCRLISACFY